MVQTNREKVHMAREEFLKPYRLAEILRLEFAELSPHQPTPTERQLAERFGVSRVSIRQTLAILVDEGVIYTIHGAGSFAAPPRASKRMRLRSFAEEMVARGCRPTTHLIDIALVAPHSARVDTWADVTEASYRIERLRLGDDRPMALDVAYIPSRVAPGLEHRNLTGSLYEILRDDYKQEIVSADDQLLPLIVDPALAAALDVLPGSAAIEIRRLSFSARSENIEQLRTVRVGDRWDFRYTLRS